MLETINLNIITVFRKVPEVYNLFFYISRLKQLLIQAIFKYT